MVASRPTFSEYGALSTRERPPQELVDQRPLEGELLVVGRGAVTALDVLVVEHVLMAELAHPGDHLPRVGGVHPIVPCGRDEQQRRGGLSGMDIVVRRGLPYIGPFRRGLPGAPPRPPRGARPQPGVAGHGQPPPLAP